MKEQSTLLDLRSQKRIRTYKVMSVCAVSPPWYISLCQNRTVPEDCGVVLHARAKGNICKSGGVSGEHAAEGSEPLLARGSNYRVNCFSPALFYFKCQNFSHYSDILKWFSNFRCFTGNNIFFMLHRAPTSWFYTWNATGLSILTWKGQKKEKRKGKVEQASRVVNTPFFGMFCIHSIIKWTLF